MLTADRRTETRREKNLYTKIRRAELDYAIRLRKVAQQVGEIVGAFPPGDPAHAPRIAELLRKYAEMLRPWAEVIGASMLADVSRRDAKAWRQITQNMGAAMRHEIEKAPTGEVMRGLLAEQVSLITSIPLKAAERVHKLTTEGLISSARYEDVKADILRTTHVTESRATLIARTEVGRASTLLTQARATHAGSDGYIWRTADDAEVRPSHRKMEGKLVQWDHPPTLDGLTGHAGALPNCRCYPQVVLPDMEAAYGIRRN